MSCIAPSYRPTMRGVVPKQCDIVCAAYMRTHSLCIRSARAGGRGCALIPPPKQKRARCRPRERSVDIDHPPHIGVVLRHYTIAVRKTATVLYVLRCFYCMRVCYTCYMCYMCIVVVYHHPHPTTILYSINNAMSITACRCMQVHDTCHRCARNM